MNRTAPALISVLLLGLISGQVRAQEKSEAGAEGTEVSAEPRCLAILPLKNLTGHRAADNAGRFFADILATELYRLKSIEIMERSEVEANLKRRHIILPRTIEPDFVQSILAPLGVEAVIIGEITRWGWSGSEETQEERGIGLSIQILRTEDGQPLWSRNISRGGVHWLTADRHPVSQEAQLMAKDIMREMQGWLPQGASGEKGACWQSQEIQPNLGQILSQQEFDQNVEVETLYMEKGRRSGEHESPVTFKINFFKGEMTLAPDAHTLLPLAGKVLSASDIPIRIMMNGATPAGSELWDGRRRLIRDKLEKKYRVRTERFDVPGISEKDLHCLILIGEEER